jgi:hypothetical protein
MGITYFCRIVEFIEDYGITEAYKWVNWNYTPGKVLIELLENPWDTESKIVQRVFSVDSRSLTIIQGGFFYGVKSQGIW